MTGSTPWMDADWAERGLAALRATFDVDGQTKREMIQFLFDEGFWDAERLSWDASVSRFNDCLNPGKPAFFKLGEIWALMRRFDRQALFEAMAADLGFELRRTPTEERRLAAMDRMADAVQTCERVLGEARTELARLNHQDTPRGRHTSTQQRAPVRFAQDDDGDCSPVGF